MQVEHTNPYNKSLRDWYVFTNPPAGETMNPYEPKPASSDEKTLQQLADDLRSNVGEMIRITNRSLAQKSRERVSLYIILPLAGVALFFAVRLEMSHPFVSGFASNFATEMIGVFLMFWLLYGGLAGLSSEDDAKLNQMRQDMDARLARIEHSISELKQSADFRAEDGLE